MGWRTRAEKHLLAARDALDDADAAMTDESTARKTDVVARQLSRGFVESGLALAEAYAARDAEGKHALRQWIGPEVVDAAVALSAGRAGKEAA